MIDIRWITAERNSPSDEQIYVLELLAEKGALIREGSEIFELEGAKAVFVLESPVAGYFYPVVEPGASVGVGAYIAYVSEEEMLTPPKIPFEGGEDQTSQSDVNPVTTAGSALDPKVEASQKAEQLAERLGINLNEIGSESFITAETVQAYYDSQTGSNSVTSSNSVFFRQERIAIVGGSQQATLAWHALIGSTEQRIVGVFDSTERNDLAEFGVPFLGKTDRSEIHKAFSAGVFDAMFIAIGGGYMDARKSFAEFASENGIPLATIVDKKAIVSSTAKIGLGSLIMDSARVGPFAVLGENVFLSAGVNIEHHCEVGQGSTFGPNVALSGRVKIGKYCRIAALVGFEPDAFLGDFSVVSSGAIINSTIPAKSVVKVVSQLKIRSRET